MGGPSTLSRSISANTFSSTTSLTSAAASPNAALLDHETAGPVPGSSRVLSRLRGSLPQRTLPALQLTSFAAGGGPGAPALRERPAAPCHPLLARRHSPYASRRPSEKNAAAKQIAAPMRGQ